MKRRRRAWQVGLAAVAMVGCFVLWRLLHVPAHDFSPAKISRVQLGMTQPEVEQALGVPPGNYCSGRAWPLPPIPDPGRYASTATWQDDELALTVGLNAEGKVVWECLSVSGSRRTSLLEQIRAWLLR